MYGGAITLIPHSGHFPGSKSDLEELRFSGHAHSPVRNMIKMLRVDAGASIGATTRAIRSHVTNQFQEFADDPRLSVTAEQVRNMSKIIKQQIGVFSLYEYDSVCESVACLML